ncbi:Fe2+-enterobactin ABC transporter substrate-binding protein [Micromonospora polyrhachis]|uniref:Iron complex transport system substrate-binding protein n=1 Tax=Micromonospora polyrhachis TaxID=1282883 RepID=A0A7W7SX20_9ACTN|nr:Fe2+-enterobactin ABC transporter substrate-binding protein [Micromonospora polyrhachis]MBB4962474.1 iron complex transport system substrate-binding protein [Micromonospora polyrhachis]
MRTALFRRSSGDGADTGKLGIRRRAGLVAAAAVVAVTALAGCGSDTDEPADNGTDKARSVTHDAGTTENVPAKPKRIVSLSVTLTGHLLALDAPVVATQVAPGPFSDKTGYFLQWSDVAKQRNVEVVYAGAEPNLEKVVEAKPDLIIGAASGADSTAKFYDQLKGIAPTLIYRYDNISWQDLTSKLGEAIGLADKAKEVLGKFDAQVTAVKGKIKVPTQDVAPLRNNGTQIVIFTKESAQGKLLATLGLKVREVPKNFSADGPEGGNRNDVVTVAQENLGPALADSSVFFVGHNAEQIATAKAAPLWKSLPAVTENRAYDLGLDSFRMDYFSASAVLERIEKTFAV